MTIFEIILLVYVLLATIVWGLVLVMFFGTILTVFGFIAEVTSSFWNR